MLLDRLALNRSVNMCKLSSQLGFRIPSHRRRPADVHAQRRLCVSALVHTQFAPCRSRPNATVLTQTFWHSSVNTNSILLFIFQPPFYCRDVAEMYDNILHKPLNLRPGVSLTAWSILEELLEKDRQNRLGAKEDFVCISFPLYLSLFII